MAYITKFEITNFKGIERLELRIAEKHKCPVVTLVGLNESGKTTILEAISHFVTHEGTISEGRAKADATNLLSLVPIARKANFTGNIVVSATVVVEESDEDTVKTIFRRAGYEMDPDQLPENFDIRRTYYYEEGAYQNTTNYWDLAFFVKKKGRAKIFRKYFRPSKQEIEAGNPDLWLRCANALEASLPAIAYFPTFLVDVPDRIYLTKYEDEHPSQQYYREVLQDILDSLGDKLDLQQHVVKRIREYQEEENNSNWLTLFFGRPEKGMVDSVVQKLSSAISREVIGSWKNIFNRPISAKMITIDWNVDLEKNAIPYFTFGISDGESKYALHERSLGFRWFFLFLLFTRFKRMKKRPTLFLFDEPAANLHARAQIELLLSFDKIVENRDGIIYSTHSTYMINPRWIPAAHIVENTAINYDSTDDMLSFSSPPTSISVIPYRQFVSEHPDRTSYFQPILDRLDHVSPKISPSGPVIVTEGISDFHAFSFYCSDLLRAEGIHLLPGLGDTGHDNQIAMLLSAGTQFIVILDDDKSGRRAAKKYREDWLLDDDHIATLGDLDQAGASKKLETILSKETVDAISSHFSNSGKPTKKQIGLYFSEANGGLISKKSAETGTTVTNIVKEAIKRIRKQSGKNG